MYILVLGPDIISSSALRSAVASYLVAKLRIFKTRSLWLYMLLVLLVSVFGVPWFSSAFPIIIILSGTQLMGDPSSGI
jgi:hypothetical protein